MFKFIKYLIERKNFIKKDYESWKMVEGGPQKVAGAITKQDEIYRKKYKGKTLKDADKLHDTFAGITNELWGPYAGEGAKYANEKVNNGKTTESNTKTD